MGDPRGPDYLALLLKDRTGAEHADSLNPTSKGVLGLLVDPVPRTRTASPIGSRIHTGISLAFHSVSARFVPSVPLVKWQLREMPYPSRTPAEAEPPPGLALGSWRW